MMANKYIKTVLIALWFGLLAIPFAGLTKAAYIAGAVLAGVAVVSVLKSSEEQFHRVYAVPGRWTIS